MKKTLLITAILFLALAAPTALSAQSCALCYTQAAGAGAKFIKGLRKGIFILMVPPMAICIGITALTWKRRNNFNTQSSEEAESDLGW